MTKPDRDVELIYSPTEIAAKLRRLADALENGQRFRIQVGGERIRVPKDAQFSVEHEREEGREEIEFQFTWTTDTTGDDESDDDAVV